MDFKKPLINGMLSLSVLTLSLVSADRVLYHIDASRSGSISYAPNMSETLTNNTGQWSFRANSKGIRYKELPLEKATPIEKRVVVLGDSFTFGENVEDDETFPALLEARAASDGQNTFFINCGISGAGPEQYFEILKRIGLAYHPDEVLIVFYANDLENLLVESAKNLGEEDRPSNYFKRLSHKFFPQIYKHLRMIYGGYKRHEQPTVLEDNLVWADRRLSIPDDAIRDWWREQEKLIKTQEEREVVYGLAMQQMEIAYFMRFLDISSGQSQSCWVRFQSIMEAFKTLCHQKGIRLSFAYAPSPYQYDAGFYSMTEHLGQVTDKSWLSGETLFESRLKDWARKHGIAFLNLTPFFRASAQEGTLLNFRVDQHWNVAGHKLAAEKIWQWMIEN